ncbi:MULTISPECIES: hypothetical protein [Rubrivivax]|uniref:Uncharacterized protein n=1 Tax=Rubrivivax benzoatilyticus TaxID=316997 RepID=A0ABX0HP26_9BURK|nr:MULTISPECIES: hypothetical protein [Rubrivivax]MCD0422986.1 hypothetical protein [Rubrivivax sp. JA1024]EGJ10473.1 hypothetical protein RBXJA2T_09107 [Rubrivivax benzoatilyticus JA2 = ATCC BAA-35]MCC9598394.1 hypothetical protein [Rubrivivax sp. JA1055]MCC9648094.1 hypothetical protein [Rubrivivax sp. JA1029]NHK96824.1 hypothetical protein [Rubrivivax benzoatilyticus]
MEFLYLKIPSTDEAADAHHALHAALEQTLAEAGQGTLLGWGGSLGEAGGAGVRPLRFHRIDIEVHELAPARALLQRRLDELGVAPGTELHYSVARRARVDVLGASGWVPRALPVR